MNNTKIAKLRKEHGWTQERLAEESHVNSRTIQRLESGEDASLETLRSVANALNVQIVDLFESSGNTRKSQEIIELDTRRQVDTRKWRSALKLFRMLAYSIFFLLMFILLAGISEFRKDLYLNIGGLCWLALGYLNFVKYL